MSQERPPRDDKRERFRATMTAQVPRWYSPWAHLAATIGICLTAVIVSLWRIDEVRWYELLAVPAAFLFANFFEWTVHRELMHRPRIIIKPLYGKHALMHHRVYRWGDMAIRDWRELPFVLLSAVNIFLVVTIMSVLALVPGMLLGPNVGWLVLITEASYVLSYELLHLSYHLPEGHPVRRIGLIRRLGEHHSRHHEPRLMRKWNLNVTIPLADWVLGTMAPKELLGKIRASRPEGLATDDWSEPEDGNR